MRTNLASLPLEIRQLIYEELFSSYTIRHGFGRRSNSYQDRAALLRTCKQIHLEAWRILPQAVTFHFRGTEDMVETLLNLDQAIVTRIRNICVMSFPFPLYSSGRHFYSTYYFNNALTLFPGLHLDQLVVRDAFHGAGAGDPWRDVVTYFDIEALLKSDGWKELVYITPTTDFLASGYDHKRKRKAQPENWNALLQDRDGEESGSEVQMFITPVSAASKEGQEATPQPWSAAPGNEVIENSELARPDQSLKGEVRIVVRRGKNTNYVQTGLSESKSWRELKKEAGGFQRDDWPPYYHDMADAVSWIYGGWGRRMSLANRALGIE